MPEEYIELKITIQDDDQRDSILSVLEDAEMDGVLDFAFNIKTEYLKR